MIKRFLQPNFRCFLPSLVHGLIRGLILILTFALPFSMTNAAAFDAQTLRYEVTYQNQNAGELEIVIAKNGDEYLITAISHLSLLAQMFLDSTTITARFEQFGDQYRLAGGEEVATETGDVRRRFSVDYDTNQISFLNGDPLPFDPTVRMDADAFPLQLLLGDSLQLGGNQLLSVSPKRGRLYTYEAPQSERVEIEAGAFDTMLVVARRTDDPNRTINYWLRDSDRVPVKIITGKTGQETILQLLP